MKNLIFICALVLCTHISFGQFAQSIKPKKMMDSLKAQYMEKLAWKNPLLRQAGLSTEVFSSGNIKSDLKGNPFFEGKYKTVRTNAFFNTSLWQGGKNRVSGGLAVSHQAMELRNVTNHDPMLLVGTTQVHNTLVGASMTFTRVDSLFQWPVVYTATASGLINPITGQHRFSGSGVATLTVHRTENTTFSVGLIGLLDPSMPIPVIPFISYAHRFKSGLECSLDPSGITLRKQWNARNSLALSNNLGGNLSLFKRDIVNLPIEQAYSTLEMKSGLIYERLMTKKMVATLSTGVRSTFTSKVLAGNSNTDVFIKNTQSPVPYVRVGVSFLPFWSGLAK